MKKPKVPSPYEDKVDLMRDLNVDLQSPDDEVIDLEDIIEMPDSPIDEDEDLDLDVEMLDVDSDREPLPRTAVQPPVEEELQGLGPEEEDLSELMEGEPEEDELLFEPAAPGGLEKPSTGRSEPLLFDDEEASLLAEAEDAISGEPVATAAAPAKVPAGASIPYDADFSQMAEQLIGQLESRLQEHIRLVVESKLPDIVKLIIYEEIEKLKKELGLPGD